MCHLLSDWRRTRGLPVLPTPRIDFRFRRHHNQQNLSNFPNWWTFKGNGRSGGHYTVRANAKTAIKAHKQHIAKTKRVAHPKKETKLSSGFHRLALEKQAHVVHFTGTTNFAHACFVRGSIYRHIWGFYSLALIELRGFFLETAQNSSQWATQHRCHIGISEMRFQGLQDEEEQRSA